MDEKSLFEREEKVLDAAKIFLSKVTATDNILLDHYKDLLNEFERTLKQSQSLIRLGDMMQLQLTALTEELKIEIANRKAIETEKEALRTQLLQSQKMEAMGTLGAGIAHDFNNMLQVILGYSSFLLADKKKADPGYQEIQNILKTSREAAELVQRISLFSGKADMNPVPMNLNNQVEELTKLLSHTLPKTIDIETHMNEDLAIIYADPEKMGQLIMNLGINAAEAMPHGGLLNIQTGNIVLDDDYSRKHVGVKTGQYVMLRISDNGFGIDKQMMERIFDPFFSTKGKDFRKGKGLGLSVVQGIVELHGGHITSESEVGRGTTFSVYFPAVEPNKAMFETPPKEKGLGF
jgi:two-component system, cell cycle sensor histidine kinase and response regulator CckA